MTVGRRKSSDAHQEQRQQDLYAEAVAACGRMLNRLAAGYEADSDRRRDLQQEIHLQLWRSLGAFDGRCSLTTWALRVAHNTAASYVIRERRKNSELVSLEEVERTLSAPAGQTAGGAPDSARNLALHDLQLLIQQLKPLDRQIIISYLEEMDAASIAEITGLSPANVAMKIHRIKKVLAGRIRKEHTHA